MGGAVLAIAQLLASSQANAARPIAEQLDSTPLYDCSHLLGAVAAAQGDTDTARAVLGAWHASDRPLIADFMHSARLWGYAECAHATDDKDAARHLYEELIPYDGQLLLWAWVFVPSSAAFTLGLLAETLGERERALAHYATRWPSRKGSARLPSPNGRAKPARGSADRRSRCWVWAVLRSNQRPPACKGLLLWS